MAFTAKNFQVTNNYLTALSITHFFLQIRKTVRKFRIEIYLFPYVKYGFFCRDYQNLTDSNGIRWRIFILNVIKMLKECVSFG